MSYTEIYTFDLDGKTTDCYDIENSFRGSMMIWTILERKYLLSLPTPEWAKYSKEVHDYYSRCATMNIEAMKEIWHLNRSNGLSIEEEITLASTMDGVLIKSKDLNRLISAYEYFATVTDDQGMTNLPQYIEVIKKISIDPTVSAIGFSISQCNSPWYKQVDDDEVPYNYNIDTNHWWLFDEIDKE